MKLSEKSPYRYLRTPEYRNIPKLRLLNFIYLGMFCLIMFGTIGFLYDTISTTLGQIASITALESGLGYQAIDFDRLQQVESAWQKKHAVTPFIITRNPFQFGVSPTTTAPAAAKPRTYHLKPKT